MSTTLAAPSLYEQLGGKAGIAAVVDEFYRRVVADELLEAMFAGHDMNQQRRHLAAFLGVALGGPNEYRGRGLREAHRGLGITEGQFAAVAGHLAAALAAGGVAALAVATILEAVAGLKGDVVAL
jgi:hemoglobin